MKRLLSFILVLSMLLAVVPVFAADEVTPIVISAEMPLVVKVNGEPIDFPDALPFIDEASRTQIPIGVVSRAMGMETDWNSDTRTATIKRGDNEVIIFIDSNILYVNNETVEMDTVAIIKDNRTFIPVRFVAESLGYEVTWDEKNREVGLTDMGEPGENDADYELNDSYKLSPRPKPTYPESFDFEVLKALPKDKNYVFSPASLKMGLSLLANGAKDETLDEILDVLGAKNVSVLNDTAVKSVMSMKSDRMKVSLDASAWYNAGTDQRYVDFSSKFKTVSRDIFESTFRIIYDTDGVTLVNAWVAEKTGGAIDFVLDNVTGHVAFLANSAYVKGQWAEPFDEKETKQRPFTDRNQKMTRTAFMMQTGKFDYYGDPYIRMLAKPYYDRRFKMYIVLTGDGRVPTEEDFRKAYSNMKSEYVHLELPKFDINTNFDIANQLNKMGIHDAFIAIWGRFAPMYEGLTKNRVPYTAMVNQVARFRVDEKGTEVTTTVIGTQKPESVPEDATIVPFICNQPFSFFVVNDETGDIIYAGEFGYLQ